MSSPHAERTEILADLEREMRWISAQSVLFSHLVAERIGLRATDLEALDILDLTGPIPAGRLGELTGLSSGAVTALIDRLEAAGCVRREPDPRDRRRVIVHPNPWPEHLSTSVAPLYVAMATRFAELCNAYSDEQLVYILQFLRGAQDAGAATIIDAQALPRGHRQVSARTADS